MNPHLKGHKSFAEMVAGHLSNYHNALVYQRDSTVDPCDKAYYQHEINALADIRAACVLEMQAAPVGMGQVAPECPKEPEVKLFGAEVINSTVSTIGNASNPYWVMMADSMRGHPRLGNGSNVCTSQVEEIWDFDGAIFARTKSGTLYKIMDWAADWIGSERFFAAAQNFPCLQGLKP